MGFSQTLIYKYRKKTIQIKVCLFNYLCKNYCLKLYKWMTRSKSIYIVSVLIIKNVTNLFNTPNNVSPIRYGRRINPHSHLQNHQLCLSLVTHSDSLVLTINSSASISSEGGYGINTQVEKSKNMAIVKFMECDLNQLFWIFVDSWMW